MPTLILLWQAVIPLCALGLSQWSSGDELWWKAWFWWPYAKAVTECSGKRWPVVWCHHGGHHLSCCPHETKPGFGKKRTELQVLQRKKSSVTEGEECVSSGDCASCHLQNNGSRRQGRERWPPFLYSIGRDWGTTQEAEGREMHVNCIPHGRPGHQCCSGYLSS